LQNLDKSNLYNTKSDFEGVGSINLIDDSAQYGQKILVVDDCLASGSTLDTVARFVKLQGGVVKELTCIMEMRNPKLEGRSVAEKRDIDVFSLMKFTRN